MLSSVLTVGVLVVALAVVCMLVGWLLAKQRGRALKFLVSLKLGDERDTRETKSNDN